MGRDAAPAQGRASWNGSLNSQTQPFLDPGAGEALTKAILKNEGGRIDRQSGEVDLEFLSHRFPDGQSPLFASLALHLDQRAGLFTHMLTLELEDLGDTGARIVEEADQQMISPPTGSARVNGI